MMEKQFDFFLNFSKRTLLVGKKGDFIQSSRKGVPINIGDNNYKTLTAFTF